MLRALEREYARFASAALSKNPEADLIAGYERRVSRVRAQVLGGLRARREAAARRGLTLDLRAAEGRLARVEESLGRAVGVAEFWAATAALSGSAARVRMLEADLHDLERIGEVERAGDVHRELFALRLERGAAQRRREQPRGRLELTDAGLLTKESFLRAAALEWERCKISSEPFGAVVFALSIPGRASHPEQIVARLLGYAQVEVARSASSPGDLVGDFGSDAVVFGTPGRAARALAELAERIRRSLEATSFTQGSVVFRIEVAAGVSSLVPSEDAPVERVLAGAADASKVSWSLAARKTVAELEGELCAVEITEEAGDEPASLVPATGGTTLADRVRAALARKEPSL